MTPLEIWFFNLPPMLSIVIIGFVITLFTSLVYKFVTDQELMKTLRAEMKELQNAMKEHKDTPDQLMKIQQKAMEKNMVLMKHSMKPTFFTAIPILILFGWLNAHIAYFPVMPDSPFEVFAEFKDGITGNVVLSVQPEEGIQFITDQTQPITETNIARWELQGREGDYTLEYTYEGETQTLPLLITPNREYKTPMMKTKSSYFKSVNVALEKVKPLEFMGLNWGWIGPYIIVSIIFSTAIRKLLKIA
jgi:uncharacterized membrane protein (DUF106 family)